MRILLTGTQGQVGSALLPLLQGRHTVVAPLRDEFDLSLPDTLPAKLDAFFYGLFNRSGSDTSDMATKVRTSLSRRLSSKAEKSWCRRTAW